MRVQAKDRAVGEKTLSKPHVVRKLIYNSKLTKFLLWPVKVEWFNELYYL